jgi:hypothetical protein
MPLGYFHYSLMQLLVLPSHMLLSVVIKSWYSLRIEGLTVSFGSYDVVVVIIVVVVDIVCFVV